MKEAKPKCIGLRHSRLFQTPSVLKVLWLLVAGTLAGSAGAAVPGLVTLSGHVPSVVSSQSSLGQLPGTNRLHLAIGLALQNQAGLDALLREISDPASPNFRHYLTTAEFAAQFGPTDQDYQKVVAFAVANHLTVTDSDPVRQIVDVEGSVSNIQQAFNVTIGTYVDPKATNRIFFAPSAEPSVNASLPILHVSGLDNYYLPQPKSHVQPLKKTPGLKSSSAKSIATASATPQAGSAPGGAYMGTDFRKAYVPGTILTGAGQNVGLLQFDGFYTNDIAAYKTLIGMVGGPNVVVVPVDGGVTTPGGGNGEVCLDIEMVLSMAPGVSNIYVYEAPNPSPWVDLLKKMANDNLAKNLSCSWGGGPPDALAEARFQQMAAQGQTFYNASGDSDAFVVGSNPVTFPSDSTNIIQVGGTTLSTGLNAVYTSETVWNWGGGVGSCGGISPNYGIPYWQTNISMFGNQGSTTKRNIPDVALTADNVYVTYNNGAVGAFGGTSCAAPLWAGFTALVNEFAVSNALPSVGFVNPALYAIAESTNYTNCFHDTTVGNNTWSGSPTKFKAVTGYDLCTGLGTPNGTNLIVAMLYPPPPTPPPTWVGGTDTNGPPNDNFVNAVPITGLTGTLSSTNNNATIEPNEPGFINTDDFASVDNSVWYAWTAPADGTVTFNTFGSSFDTVLAVYIPFPGVDYLVAGNDDYITLIVPQSQLTFKATAGTTYYISVNGNASPAPGYTDAGSFVLNWNEVVPSISSGTFSFTLDNYIVSESDRFNPQDPAMAGVPAWPYVPPFVPPAARVTVTRSAGSSGRVSVPYNVTTVSNQTDLNFDGTLVFDDYQMSADIYVPLSAVPPQPVAGTNIALPGIVSVTLGVPALDDLESPDLLPPDVGLNAATVTVLSRYYGVSLEDWANTRTFFVIERSTFRVRRTQGTAVVYVIPSTAGPCSVQYAFSKTVRPAYSPTIGSTLPTTPTYIYSANNTFQLQADSDYATPGEDFVDAPAGGGTLTWATGESGAKPINITILDTTNAQFNEDIEVELFNPRNGAAQLALGQVNTATVTILYDKQPAGAVDRTWNKDGANDSIPPFLQFPGTQGGVSDSANGNGGAVYAVAEQPDGKAILAGSFISFDSNPYNRIVRVLNNGYQDPTFLAWPNSGADDSIYAVALQPDGKILIGGNFTSFNGVNRYRIARLNADGSVDNTFNPGLGADGIVRALALQTNGQVVIAGQFNLVNGTNMTHVARLNADGSLDISFNPASGPDGLVNAVVVDPQGRVIIGGEFSTVSGVQSGAIARLNVDGSVDPTFAPGIGTYNPGTGMTDPIYSLALQPDGKVLAGGSFANVEMVGINGIARFNTNGTVDTAFSTFGTNNGTYNPVTAIADAVNVITLQADGKIYIGGDFTTINQTRRVGLARLFTTGSLDTSFMDTAYNQFAGIINHYHNPDAVNTNDYPQGNHRNAVRAIALEAGGDVIVGGNFLQVGGGSYTHSGSIDSVVGNNVFYGIILNGRMDVHPRSNVARLIGGVTPGPGNIEFSYSNYSVDKDASTLFVSLLRTNGNLGDVAATFSSPPGASGQQGIAQEGTDFTIGNTTPTWASMWNTSWMVSDAFTGQNFIGSPGNNAAEFLTIINNVNITGNMIANLALVAPDGSGFALGGETIALGAAIGAQQVSPMTIIDDNFPAGTFSFSAPAYTVNEGNTIATITVVRNNGFKGNVNVSYAAYNGSATSPTNYNAVSGTLPFTDGVMSNQFTVQIKPGTSSQPDKTVNLALFGITGGGKPGLTNSVLTIINNIYGAGHIAFAFATNGVNENAGTASVVLSRLGASSGTLDVTAMTSNGSAVNGVNYIGSTNVVHWNDADALPKSITIPIKHDGLFTSNLTVNISLTNGLAGGKANVNVLGLSTITNSTLVITNVDFPGTVEFTAAAYSVKKYAGFVNIPVIRTGGSAGTLTVTNYTFDGTALNGVDYTGQTNVLTFTNGQVSQSFTVPITVGASNGLVALNLALTNAVLPSYPLVTNALGSPNLAVLNIIDTDAVNESPGSPDTTYSPLSGFNDSVYAVTLQTNNQLIVGGDFTMANGVPRQRLARMNSDGTLDPSFSLPTSAMGADASVRAVAMQSDGRIIVGGYFTNFNSVAMNGITRLNFDGSLDSRFSPGSGANNPVFAVAETFVGGRRKILLGGGFTRLNGVVVNGIGRLNADDISGDDGRPDPTFNPGGLGANGIVYALAVQTDGKVVFGGDFTSVNGVAANHVARMNVNGSLDLTFTNASANDSVRAIAIQLDGRILIGGLFTSVNGNTNFNHLARLNSADGSADSSFTPGLGANDAVFSIALQTDSRIILGGSFTRCSGVTRNRITRLNLDGTVDPSINFGVGADSFVATIAVQEATIAGYPDSVPDEKIIIGGGFTHYFGQVHQHLARIYGGSIGGSGAFQFSAANYGVNENGSNAVITVTRTGGTSGTNANGSGNVFVNFATSDGSALADTDHAAVTNYFTVITNLAFVAGEIQQTVAVPVMDDHVINSNLTVNLTLVAAPPAVDGNQPTAVLTITNVDSAINFSSASYLTTKYDASVPNGFAPILINRSGATYGTSTVVFNTPTNGTAVPGLDFLPLTNVLVTFAPGVTVQQVDIPIINGLPDGDRTVNLQLTNVTGSALYDPSNAVLTILDRTLARGSFVFSATNYVVSEGGGVGNTNAVITVLRTNGASGIVSVGYATSDGTAVAGVKYAATSGVLTYGDGEMSKSFVVPVFNTPTIEPTEFFTVSLANPTGGASLGGLTNATVTIQNTNIGIVFASATNTFIETQPFAVLNVMRYNNTQGTTTVNYSTTNGTAVAGINYAASTGTLTFNSGASQAAILIPLMHDTNVTGDLQFTVGLSSPSSGVQIGTPGMTTVVLQDADNGLSFTTNSSTVFKNAGTVLITVICSNTNIEPVSVSYATADGSATNHATAGVDYTATSGTLTFSNGVGLQTFTVPIINNGAISGDHSFNVSLSNPTGAGQLIAPSLQTVTIKDSNSGLNFSSANYSVFKTAGYAVITVYRTDNTDTVSTVNFTATNGTAVNGLHYFSTNGTLVFTNGVTVQTFNVPVIATTTVQPDKTVLLELSNPVNGILLAPSAATLTIRDNTGSYVIPAGSQLVSESNAGLPNGLIDSNETVQVLFAFRDAAGLDVTNLIATLLPTNGVTAPSPASQTYGRLVSYGHSVSMPFTFTAQGTNNQQISATFNLKDGLNPIGSAVFGYTLGTSAAVFSNNAAIIINDNSAASPYPSVISVSGVGGALIKATVTLNRLSHSNPHDISALVTAPAGTNTLIMSHAGGSGFGATNLVLTFDDAATNSLPLSGAITNGVYKPTATNPPNKFP